MLVTKGASLRRLIKNDAYPSIWKHLVVNYNGEKSNLSISGECFILKVMLHRHVAPGFHPFGDLENKKLCCKIDDIVLSWGNQFG